MMKWQLEGPVLIILIPMVSNSMRWRTWHSDTILEYFGYIWQILAVWSRLRARFDMPIPRILGLRDGSREPHYDIIAHFRSQLCRPVSIQVMIYDRYDRYDGWNETKWCSKQFFNIFSITLLDFCLNFSKEKTIAALHGVSLLGAEGRHQRLLLARLF